MRQRTSRKRWLGVRAVLAGVALAGMVAGCAGTESMSRASDEEASPGDAGGGQVSSLADTDTLKRSAPGAAGTAGRVGVQTRAVIATGEVTLEAGDLTRVRGDLDRLLGRYGGSVAQERTSGDGAEGPVSSRLVLRVPSPRFHDLMAAFDDVADVTSTRREEVDVTTEVIDVDARISTAEVSLQRLRKFLGRATAVSTVIRLESEISRREADLASLRAQQDYLADQTSLATVNVLMRATGTDASADPDDPLEDAGFLSGLRNGWEALLDILVVGATVLGALVPFAVALGLTLTPVLLWLRARRRTAAPPTPPVAPAG